jgi:hypothetical protein
MCIAASRDWDGLYLVSFLGITPANPKTLEPHISRILGSGVAVLEVNVSIGPK